MRGFIGPVPGSHGVQSHLPHTPSQYLSKCVTIPARGIRHKNESPAEGGRPRGYPGAVECTCHSCAAGPVRCTPPPVRRRRRYVRKWHDGRIRRLCGTAKAHESHHLVALQLDRLPALLEDASSAGGQSGRCRGAVLRPAMTRSVLTYPTTSRGSRDYTVGGPAYRPVVWPAVSGQLRRRRRPCGRGRVRGGPGMG